MGPRTWTRSPDLRREQLLEAAMALFDSQGPGVTVSEITRAAGVAKGTFYVYFTSKSELIAQLRETMLADYRMQMAKAFAASSPAEFASGFSSDTVGVAIDFLASDLHAVLFPTAVDQARGQREVVDGYEELLIDANRKGMTNVPDPHWFAVLLVGAANFAVGYGREAESFDRDGLVAAIVELQRRALEL